MNKVTGTAKPTVTALPKHEPNTQYGQDVARIARMPYKPVYPGRYQLVSRLNAQPDGEKASQLPHGQGGKTTPIKKPSRGKRVAGRENSKGGAMTRTGTEMLEKILTACFCLLS